MTVSHLLLILHKKYSFISLCLKPEMWQKVAKFKGAEYFRKALYLTHMHWVRNLIRASTHGAQTDRNHIYITELNLNRTCKSRMQWRVSFLPHTLKMLE